MKTDQIGPGSLSNEGSNGGSGRSIQSAGSREEKLAENEDIWVQRSKVLVIAVLLTAASLCAAFAYLSTEQVENQNFKSEFSDYADEILDVSQNTVENIFATLGGTSTTITSFALHDNVTWPFVTVPHFAFRGQNILDVSGAVYASLNPLVTDDNRAEWEQYTAENQGWVQEAAGANASIIPFIHRTDNVTGIAPEDRPADPYHAPIWQLVPAYYAPSIVNYNLMDYPTFSGTFKAMAETSRAVLSEAISLEDAAEGGSDPSQWPQSFATSPVYDELEGERTLVATIIAVLPWHNYFLHVIPEGVDGALIVVVKSTCGQVFSYEIQGSKLSYFGEGDFHDTDYNSQEVSAEFAHPTTGTALSDFDGLCLFSIHIYPTDSFRDSYHTTTPLINTVVVLLTFVITSVVFLLYDCFVQRRQNIVLSSAMETNALVSSLFPANVRDRMKKQSNFGNGLADGGLGSEGADERASLLTSRPIADLFPNATVVFGDVAGFTSWSSEREPGQVFILLEQIYNAFDVIAKRRGVFKIETIGDCYVATTGLPVPTDDHAEVMAKFARECRVKMNALVRQLEVSLGPGTADLTMRFGLHSGPVTAGVLRGEKSRFQLFGDTVNTASRIETTGERDKIHLSQTTADLLIQSDKGDWVVPREDLVTAKGKGQLQTYWLILEPGHNNSMNHNATGETCDTTETQSDESNRRSSTDFTLALDPKTRRLVDWNVEILLLALKNIVAAKGSQNTTKSDLTLQPSAVVLDELSDVIDIVPSSAGVMPEAVTDAVELGPTVQSQLRDFVTTIASMHGDHLFHNFVHGSHVAQAVNKLLFRVQNTDKINTLLSHPLIQFTCLFSALIHNVDHAGVPNAQLVKEENDMARHYRNQSVSEQNAINIAWDLLMEPRYGELRGCIFTNHDELSQFRKLLVNGVITTDIMSNQLSSWRVQRWEQVFDTPTGQIDESQESIQRAATVVVEHLLLASHVSHTMQHFIVFKKWNELLFKEMRQAYLAGRADEDPALSWYKRELGFFDDSVIPLAKRLKACGVFGVSGDEFLSCALINREEWESKGELLVEGYMASYTD